MKKPLKKISTGNWTSSPLAAKRYLENVIKGIKFVDGKMKQDEWSLNNLETKSDRIAA